MILASYLSSVCVRCVINTHRFSFMRFTNCESQCIRATFLAHGLISHISHLIPILVYFVILFSCPFSSEDNTDGRTDGQTNPGIPLVYFSPAPRKSSAVCGIQKRIPFFRFDFPFIYSASYFGSFVFWNSVEDRASGTHDGSAWDRRKRSLEGGI